LNRLSALRPQLAVVLGSGFQGAADSLAVDAEAGYEELHGFPPVGVGGHAGRLRMGRLGGTPILVLCGRAHYYEGCELDEVTFAVRVLAAFGVRDLLLTNAAGGVNRKYRPGDFMLAADHINWMGANPLRGPVPGGLTRFVDMTRAYDPRLRRMLLQAARRCALRLREGVYLALSGPSYETPAEVRALGRLGADVVGMSTVPEVIVARQVGLRVAALSCVTNLAAGGGKRPVSHEEVLAAMVRAKAPAAGLLAAFAEIYGAAK
jgi:purine-nucleoside phosphorylase